MTNEGGVSRVSIAKFTALGPAPSNAFTHTQPKIARDGTITETVKLPGKGKIALRETSNGKLIARATQSVKATETLTIKLVPRKATRRVLASRHAAAVTLSMA